MYQSIHGVGKGMSKYYWAKWCTLFTICDICYHNMHNVMLCLYYTSTWCLSGVSMDITMNVYEKNLAVVSEWDLKDLRTDSYIIPRSIIKHTTSAKNRGTFSTLVSFNSLKISQHWQTEFACRKDIKNSWYGKWNVSSPHLMTTHLATIWSYDGSWQIVVIACPVQLDEGVGGSHMIKLQGFGNPSTFTTTSGLLTALHSATQPWQRPQRVMMPPQNSPPEVLPRLFRKKAGARVSKGLCQCLVYFIPHWNLQAGPLEALTTKTAVYTLWLLEVVTLLLPQLQTSSPAQLPPSPGEPLPPLLPHPLIESTSLWCPQILIAGALQWPELLRIT